MMRRLLAHLLLALLPLLALAAEKIVVCAQALPGLRRSVGLLLLALDGRLGLFGRPRRFSRAVLTRRTLWPFDDLRILAGRAM